MTLCVQSPEILKGVSLPYKRAMFGTVPTCDPYLVAVASPVEGCRPYEIKPWNTSVDATPVIVFAERGVCKFEDKAVLAHRANATAVLVSNSREGEVCRRRCVCHCFVTHLPVAFKFATALFLLVLALQWTRMPVSSGNVKVPIPAVMIPYQEGRLFQASKLLNQPVILERKTSDCLGGVPWKPLRPQFPPKT